MAEISARDALRYAIDAEMLKLYGVLAGGWILTFFAETAARTDPRTSVTLVAIGALLVGALAVLGGIVAIAHKVLVESRAA